MTRTQKEIREELLKHFAAGGTMNDSTTNQLYREAYDIPDDAETDLEEVENWAVYGN